MTEILTIIGLAAIQFIIGLGILSCLNIRGKSFMRIALCILTGLMIFAIIPYFLQIIHLPITAANIAILITLAAVIANSQFKKSWRYLKDIIANIKLPKLYEIPFFLIIGFIFLMGAWRCYYEAPVSRDLTSGSEAIAEYTVKENTMINSVFTVNMDENNNIFKPPSVTSLQVIYKYAGFPFGQVWLINVVLCFLVFMYGVLTEKIHPILAGTLLLFLIAAPEFYAYSFMVLFDYTNTVFYTITCYFLYKFFTEKTANNLIFASIMGGFATYLRSETPILIGLLSLILLAYFIRKKTPFITMLWQGGLFLGVPFIFYFVTSYYYIHSLPIAYPVSDQINKKLGDLGPLWDRFSDINSKLLFCDFGITLYGYLIYLFTLFFIADMIFFFIPDIKKRKAVNKPIVYWLLAIATVYFGVAIIGFLLPLADLFNTTKRELFKLLPLLVIYLSFNRIVLAISKWIPV
ncbi:MAG TPA: hypothetical protein VK559_12235 [Ferruginibacter sp.]|nr:hypothetical protein [Ferruginibacter sp.]